MCHLEYAPIRSPHKKNGLAHLQIFLLSWQPAYQLVLRPAHDLLGIAGGQDLQVTRVPGGPIHTVRCFFGRNFSNSPFILQGLKPTCKRDGPVWLEVGRRREDQDRPTRSSRHSYLWDPIIIRI